MSDELVIFKFSLTDFLSLFVELFLHELEKGIGRDVFEVAIISAHEPLEYFVKSVLFALLVGNIVTVGRLLVELSEGVGGLLKAQFQTV